jgi:hypothetical protein
MLPCITDVAAFRTWSTAMSSEDTAPVAPVGGESHNQAQGRTRGEGHHKVLEHQWALDTAASSQGKCMPDTPTYYTDSNTTHHAPFGDTICTVAST